MQPRMTCFLCYKRFLALRNSLRSSKRLRQHTFLSSTYLRCFQIPHQGSGPEHSRGHSPPHDGFALLAALPRERRRCVYVTLNMSENNKDVKGVDEEICRV